MPKFSSKAITSSTVSSEAAPRSSAKGGVERVGAQVVHKRSGRSNFTFIHTELLDNNRFHAFFDAGHSGSSSGIGNRKRPGLHSRQDSAPKQLAHSMRAGMQGQPFGAKVRKLQLC